MKGDEFCRRLRAMPGLRDLPVYLIAADEDPKFSAAALQAGATDVFARADMGSLLEMLAETVLRGGAEW